MNKLWELKLICIKYSNVTSINNNQITHNMNLSKETDMENSWRFPFILMTCTFLLVSNYAVVMNKMLHDNYCKLLTIYNIRHARSSVL